MILQGNFCYSPGYFEIPQVGMSFSFAMTHLQTVTRFQNVFHYEGNAIHTMEAIYHSASKDRQSLSGRMHLKWITIIAKTSRLSAILLKFKDMFSIFFAQTFKKFLSNTLIAFSLIRVKDDYCVYISYFKILKKLKI